MRIQILPLPTLTLGDAVETPFVIVYDRLTEADERSLSEGLLDSFGTEVGARASLAVGAGDVVDISPQLDLPDDVKQALVDRIAIATTKETS